MFADVADVTPPIDQTPPSESRIGPPESPEHTELTFALNCVSSSVPTAEIAVTPARSVAGTSNWFRPHPAMTAASPTRASGVRSSGIGVRPMGWGVTTADDFQAGPEE